MREYNRLSKYSREELQILVRGTTSISGMLRACGYSVMAGGSFVTMKKTLQKHGIDTSHWTGRGWNKDSQLKDWSQYTRRASLRKQILRNRPHQCDSCKLYNWFDKCIPLELHHRDGDGTNNNLDNLQLLCPNCHALTDSWRGRNI